MTRKSILSALAGLLAITLFSVFFCGFAHGEPEEKAPAEASPSPISPDKIRDMVETALTTESAEIMELNTKIANLETYEKATDATLSAISLQHTAHESLLHLSDADMQKIAQAKAENEDALEKLTALIETAEEEASIISERLAKVENQLLINQKELDTVRESMPDNPVTNKLIGQIKTLDEQLNTKKSLLQKMAGIYEASLTPMKAAHDQLSAMQNQFENTIAQRKKENLFKRGTTRVDDFDITRINDLLADLPGLISTNIQNDYKKILEAGLLRTAGMLLFVLMVLAMMIRFKRKIYQWDQHVELAKLFPERHMVLRMAGRSLPLAWAAVVLYFYAFIRNFYATVLLSGFSFVAVYIWLWTKWGLDAVYYWNEKDVRPIPAPLAVRLRRLMRLVRYFIITALFIVWIFGQKNIISEIIEIIFYLALAVWSVGFNRRFRIILSETPTLTKAMKTMSKLAIVAIYLIPLGGFVINLSGFRGLSGYWLTSWNITLAIALWSWLTFNLIREWHDHFRKTSRSDAGKTGQNRPLRWFFIQISWLTWLWITVVGLTFAWYFDKTRFLWSIVELMNLSLTLGSFSISLSKLLQGIIVVMLIHMLTRIWPKIFEEKFLADSGMNAGIKSSVTVITTYVIWSIGFIIFLNILGVDFKAMAVAFGGLGIGLGFGLQAIFNNFFSGIILLFERPIQVGDVVEVGGVWGEVKKINVRATLIQTYDNASLLIPNSEFISGQVTNWSFKDFRIRRSINVGVAYGSDVALVEKILLSIADETPDAYKYPKPTVLFRDFGDSALIFQLRVWSHVDNCLTVETAVRFAIDREFRSNGIEIPFPQRDIHIRSVEAQKMKSIDMGIAAAETDSNAESTDNSHKHETT